MHIQKRVVDASKFLFSNPVVFLVYLPLTILTFIAPTFYLDTSLGALLSLLYILLFFLLSSYVFTFIILKAEYFEDKKEISLRHNFSMASKKFLPLLFAEIILVLLIAIGSVALNLLSMVWTSNLGIAASIILSILFISLLIKLLLFAPSAVFKGKLGFRESWSIVGWSEFFELALLLLAYALISFGLSYVPYVGNMISSLVLGPFILVVLTMLYFDYARK